MQRVYTGPNTYEEKVIRKLTSGDHFGELALINEDKRTLSVRVGSKKLKLLALDRDAFNRILGQIDQYLNRDYSDLMKSLYRVDQEEEKKANDHTFETKSGRQSSLVFNNNWNS